MTATPPAKSSNGGPDWALAFAEFHARHRDVKGKKLVFTAIFNAAMESFIQCPEVPLIWRVLAWIWRQSWGNDSDYCVEGIGGSPLGQQACADRFEVDKRRVNDCVTLLRSLNFILPPSGHKLYPVDDPTRTAPQDEKLEDPKSPDPSGLFKEYCAEWEVRNLADFQELESAEATVNRIKIVRLGGYKPWLRERSNHAQTVKPNIQHSSAVPIPPRPSSSSAVVPMREPTPKAEEEEGEELYPKFKESYPPEHFDEPKAKPSFEKKTRTEQLRILERLQVYLICDRWRDAGGQWIPLAGKWLESYNADPPPLLKKSAATANGGADAEKLKRLAAEIEEDRKWR